jgi:hypothetical protein
MLSKFTFSNSPLRTASNSRSFSSQKPPPPPNPSFGGASFKDLGASRTVKIVVYSFLGVAATLETVAWTKFLYEKFGPSKPDEGEARNE